MVNATSSTSVNYNIINGTNDDDILDGTNLNDFIRGGDGRDVIFGKEGNDVLRGGKGNDSLYGEAGNDTLLGHEGNDILIGGDGANILNGGLDNDTAIVGWQDTADGGSGNDKLDMTGMDIDVKSLAILSPLLVPDRKVIE
ncbi:MAG: hypothetical protein AAF228_10140 [Pseudomonadota bacterium]